MKKLPAVYVIADHTAGKAYVGSSSQLPVRLREHAKQLEGGYHHNWKLQKAFRDGNQLSVNPILLREGEDPVRVEQALLDEFYSDGVLYNLSRDATAAFKGRKHTEESKEKNRLSHMGMRPTAETREILSQRAQQRGVPRSTIEAGVAARRGKPLSDEHRQKVSAASKAAMTPEAREHLRQVNLGIGHTPEDIERMKQIKRERAGQPVCIEGRTFGSYGEAAEALGVKAATVQARVKSSTEKFSNWKRV